MSVHKAFSAGYLDRLAVLAVEGVPRDVVIVGAFVITNPADIKTIRCLEPLDPMLSRIYLAAARIRDALDNAGLPISTRVYREEGEAS